MFHYSEAVIDEYRDRFLALGKNNITFNDFIENDK